MRIVVDAMGTDNHPKPDVEGAVLAAREFGIQIILVGDEKRVRTVLSQHDTNGLSIEVIHAEQNIVMDDKPSVVGKSKPQSSMHIGMQLVNDDQADGFVTMGNTGAAHAIAMLFVLRRIRGIKRPALSAIFRIQDRPIIFLDIGANTDTKAEWLVQFALMGSVYAQHALGLPKPRIGILSNGEEEGKGTQLIREAGAVLQSSTLNFVGNVEPIAIFEGACDVVVTDGFTGNILAKTFEASTRYLVELMREEIKRNPVASLGGLMIRPAMNHVRRRIDTAEVGGAPLLGVNGVVIIGHGSSTAFGVKNAIHQAQQAAEGGVVKAIEHGLAQLPSGVLTTDG